ncbi:MAG: hypothetical protein N3A54_07395, partial [Patescibacteria group bacterium]|nr:hypothetical protein [Patescibacteria group bacterium]
KEDAIVFFHKPTGKEEKNFHAHVLMKTVKADGRCLDVKKAHLRAFHQAWQEYLTNAGYQIFRARDYIPEITPKISRAFDLPVYLYRREDFMPEAKRLYQRIRTEARRLMEMKRRPTRMEERELREKKEAQLQNPPQLKPELKPDKEPEPELQPELQPQPEPEPQPDKEPEPQPEPEEEPEPKPQQQSQQQPQPRPKSVDYLAFIIARNLLEAGRPREEAFIRLYNYLRKKHPEKANLVYVSNIVNKALLSLMEEQRKKEQRDYPESDEFLGPGL